MRPPQSPRLAFVINLRTVVQALAEGGALLLQVRKADAAVTGNRDNEHRIEDGDDRQDLK